MGQMVKQEMVVVVVNAWVVDNIATSTWVARGQRLFQVLHMLLSF